jgi:hypothetical protein
VGDADFDALRETYRAEQQRLDEAVVIAAAESAATAPRRDELAALQQAARRRLSAARGQLTKAQKDGDAAKIAAARARLEAASAEFDRVCDTVIGEMHDHVRGHLDNLGAINEHIGRAWAAGDAVIEALADRRPPASPAGPA